MNPDDIDAAVAAMKAQGAPDEAIHSFLRDHLGMQPVQGSDIHAEYQSGRLAKRMQRENANDADQANAETPSYGEQALGGLASLARDIPGAEALQAGARSLFRGQPYSQALQDIRGAEADAPKAVTIPNRIIGGTVAGAALPIKSPVAAGAMYGALSGLLKADGDAPDRLKSAAMQAGTGAAIGYAAPRVAAYAASKLLPTIGAQDAARQAALKAADDRAYGLAQMEGNASVITPPVAKAMENPITASYIAKIRSAPQYTGADDATVIREAYKLMSRDQTGHATFMENNGFDADRQLKMDAIGTAKREMLDALTQPGQVTFPAVLRRVTAPAVTTAQSPNPSLRDALNAFTTRLGLAATRNEGTVAQQSARTALERHAAENVVSPPLSGAPPGPRSTITQLSPEQTVQLPPVMPSYPAAVAQHARLTKVAEAGQEGADIAQRLLTNTHIKGANLPFKSPEAFQASIGQMTPDEAGAALDMMLGRAKEFRGGATKNPLTAFGALSAPFKMSALQPYLAALAKQAGRAPFGTGTRAVGQSLATSLFN